MLSTLFRKPRADGRFDAPEVLKGQPADSTRQAHAGEVVKMWQVTLQRGGIGDVFPDEVAIEAAPPVPPEKIGREHHHHAPLGSTNA